MGDIFICHTLYHVLIALVRALRSRPGKSTLVLSTCVPEAEPLRAKLLDTAPDLWDAVLIVDEEKLDAQNSESDFYRLRHPFRKPYFTLPKGHVYISNDWSALGRYLQRERRVYTLCEDTFGGTLDPDQHLLDEQRTNPRPLPLLGRQPLLPHGGKRRRRAVQHFWRRQAGNGIQSAATGKPDGGRKSHHPPGVFGRSPAGACAGCLPAFAPQLCAGRLMDQPTQDAMFAAVAKKYCTEPLFIKTHPRDTTDYSKLFPTAVILPRTMPSEVLNFCLPFKFQRAVTVQSWVLRGFTAAEEKVFVGLEEAEKLVQG